MKRLLSSPLINVLVFSLFWAVEIFITKLAFLAGADLIPYSLQSAFFTLVFLTCYMFLTKRHKLKNIPPSLLKMILLANAIHMGLGWFFSNAGIQLTSAINAGFLMQFTIVSGTVFAWFMIGEKMTIEKVLSIFVVILGSFLLITKGQFIIPHAGDILILLACTAWGLGGVMIRKLLLKHPHVDADIISFLRPVAGIPVIFLLLLFSPLYPTEIQKAFHFNIFVVSHWMFVLLNAFFVSFVWIFVNRTLKVASASYTAVMSSVTPILVALLAIIFLKERIDHIQLVGIFLIIAASFITEYTNVDKH